MAASKASRRAFLAFPVIALLCLAPHGAAAGPAVSPAQCAARYHVALQAVRAGAFQNLAGLDIKTLLGTAPGEAGLPGRLTITAAPGKPGPALAKARRLAVQLAAQRGARSLPATASSRWVADRVRTDLSDYLTQGPSPYLCAGIDNYLGTLRRYTDQLAVTDDRLDEAGAALRQSAQTAGRAALDAMMPAPPPRFAPLDRPNMQIAEPGTLPATDALEEQGDGPGLLTLVAQRQPALQRGDLAPAAPRPAIAMDDRVDLERAARRLVFAARRGGFITLDPIAARAAPGAGAASYIATLAPALANLSDPLVRPALLNALADLEALDTILVARTGGQDPVGAALDETMRAIRTAHDTACACGSRQ